MTKDLIKILIAEYQKFVCNVELVPREVEFVDGQNYVFVGLRHVGKSYLMYQRIAQLVAQGHHPEEILYFNFEDDRIDSLDITDLELIKTSYEEMYDSRPILFLDEVQLVERWEKFARRLADQKYQVYITGSNAKMLSSEIATTLGGRYMILEVFPYSFSEYLSCHGISLKTKGAEYAHHAEIVKLAVDYLRHGGMPEAALMKKSRQWLSSLFDRIFFGDLIARHKIRNDFALRVLVRKLAESVMQPLSYTRIANIVSNAGKKLSTDAAIDYVGYMVESWLILPFENLYGKLQDKETTRKYYFTDNGILALFLVDGKASLLENIVAVSLRRLFSNGCYYWSSRNAEVDFVVPDMRLGVQVSYVMNDVETERREVSALLSVAKYLDLEQLVVITMDEERTIECDGRRIEVIPLWRWLSQGYLK